jgi:hypothetical protein
MSAAGWVGSDLWNIGTHFRYHSYHTFKGLLVPKPTREEMYQLLTLADLPCTVRGRPPTFAGVSRRCYSVGYSPAQGRPQLLIRRPCRWCSWSAHVF